VICFSAFSSLANDRIQMKIAVCIKQVQSRDSQPRLNDARTWVRDQDAAFEMNEPDAYALEESLRLKEKHGGEVVVCSAGPARVAQVLREALARGADRAIHVQGDSLAAGDAFVVSAALAAAMKDEKFDLILTGLQSDDQGFGQTGVVLAERLGLPHATIIMDVQVSAGPPATLRQAGTRGRLVPVGRHAATRDPDDPERHQPARYATLKGIMAAKKKEIRVAAPEAAAPKQRIVALYAPEKSKKTQLISGSPAEAAKELVRRLREEARVI
jgi:electron transfer flavoprotein beta subunit